ncbi:MAG: winged helix-turn-helix domain-containing protein [Pseudomonadota bacterium]
MNSGTEIVKVAALIGDQARAYMLTALMSGRALTATELASIAGVTRQTASSHLGKLKDAGLVGVATQGRHRYFRLAAPDVAQLLENLMGVAQRTGATTLRVGPRDPELRKARVCYDHLAGDLSVELYDALVKNRCIRLSSDTDSNQVLTLTRRGREMISSLAIDIDPRPGSRRPLCRPCLDWSERRYHLAGQLGARILDFCYRKKWAKRLPDSRIVVFTTRGEAAFRATFLGQHQEFENNLKK